MKKNLYKFKPGAGTHRQGQRFYHPGDEIELYEWQTEGFADKLELIQAASPPEPPPEEFSPPETQMEIAPSKYTQDGFDVIRPDGKALNDTPLVLEDAKALAGSSAKFRRVRKQPSTPPEKPLDGVLSSVDSIPQRKLTAIHRGAGRWVVMDEITGDIIAGAKNGYLTREQAEAMVKPG